MAKHLPIYLANYETKETNSKLWYEIKEKGTFIRNEYTFDFIVSIYDYDNKRYGLWFNDNYGYNDFIEVYEV